MLIGTKHLSVAMPHRVCLCALIAVFAVVTAASAWTTPPASFVSGNDYADEYGASGNTATTVTGGGTATFSGYWNAKRESKTLWKSYGSTLYVNAGAEFDNNVWTNGELLYAKNVQFEGTEANIGVNNEVFELDTGFNADRGSGTIGQTSGNNIVGGMTTLRIHNARYITHHSQSLPSSWKHTKDAGAWFPSGTLHETHHGLLIFDDIYTWGPSTEPNATSNEWWVRSNSQTYDGGLYWHKDFTLDIADGLIFSSNTHFEQAAIGPHVGFGTRATNTTLTKTGTGALVIARAGLQGYRSGSVIDIQEGRVEFNSNENHISPSYYLPADGQTLELIVAEGAEVDFHAYSYPIDNNWWTGGTYGPDSMHEIKSLQASGIVKVGGLWTPSSDQLDIDYQGVMDSIQPETANARDAKLDVDGALTLTSTAELRIILGADSASESWQVRANSMTQAGQLTILDDGTMAVGTYDLVDGSLSGAFTLALPEHLLGSYNSSNGELTISSVVAAGDLDKNGVVTFLEAATVVANLGKTGAAFADGDFDTDGTVELYEAEAAVATWNANQGTSLALDAFLIPEPATASLLALAAAVLLGRRRR